MPHVVFADTYPGRLCLREWVTTSAAFASTRHLVSEGYLNFLTFFRGRPFLPRVPTCGHVNVNDCFLPVQENVSVPRSCFGGGKSLLLGCCCLRLRPLVFDCLWQRFCTADQGYTVRLGDTPPSFIDGTHKGNISRFINHSCKPNLYRHTVSNSGCRLLRYL